MGTQWWSPYPCLSVFVCCVALFSLVRYRPVSSDRSGRIVRSLHRTVRSRSDYPVGVGLYKNEDELREDKKDLVGYTGERLLKFYVKRLELNVTSMMFF